MTNVDLGPSNNQIGRSFTQRVLIIVGISVSALVLLYLFANIFDVLLLILAGVLLATLLREAAKRLSKHTKVTEGWATLLISLGIVALLVLSIWLLAPQVNQQVDQLSKELPKSIENLEKQLATQSWGQFLLGKAHSLENSMADNKETWIKKGFGILSSTFGVLANIYVIFFISIFVAAQPKVYKQGVIMLFPLKKRDRATDVMDQLGETLYKWFVGKLFSMLVVGILTAIGLWALGIPMALVLGLIAAFLSFIPNFGPILALIPAVLVALLAGPNQALYVVILYISIQAVESNLLTPLVQKKMIAIPPALIIVAQIIMGVFSGGIGLILATPVIAIAIVLVKMLYVHDTLGDKDVQLN